MEIGKLSTENDEPNRLLFHTEEVCWISGGVWIDIIYSAI